MSFTRLIYKKQKVPAFETKDADVVIGECVHTASIINQAIEYLW